MQNPVYCFIDDSPFEISLMRDVIAPHAPGVDFICCGTFAECDTLLQECGVYPALFILDLYGSRGTPGEEKIPAYASLKSRTENFMTLEAVYDGLDRLEGNARVQEFMKRLFAVVCDWRSLHAEVFRSMGHDREYGKKNFALAKQRYPLAARVFYTRKSTIEDAIDLFPLGIDGIFLKPTGAGGRNITAVTEEQCGGLLGQWREVVRRNGIGILREYAGMPASESGDRISAGALCAYIDALSEKTGHGSPFSKSFIESLHAWAAFLADRG